MSTREQLLGIALMTLVPGVSILIASVVALDLFLTIAGAGWTGGGAIFWHARNQRGRRIAAMVLGGVLLIAVTTIPAILSLPE